MEKVNIFYTTLNSQPLMHNTRPLSVEISVGGEEWNISMQIAITSAEKNFKQECGVHRILKTTSRLSL